MEPLPYQNTKLLPFGILAKEPPVVQIPKGWELAHLVFRTGDFVRAMLKDGNGQFVEWEVNFTDETCTELYPVHRRYKGHK